MTNRRNARDDAPVHETRFIGGVKDRAIIIVPDRQDCPETFRLNRERIALAIGAGALGTDHIGPPPCPVLPRNRWSTCVSWSRILAMRMPIVQRWRTPARCRGCASRSSRNTGFFAPRSLTCTPTCSRTSPAEIESYLRFRDALRAGPFLRTRYQRLKLTLVAQDRPDMNAYAQAKSEVVEAIIDWSMRTDRRGPQVAPGGG